ncbi:MAG: iron-sulfur cluster assembly protein [Bacteroidota bacterium]
MNINQLIIELETVKHPKINCSVVKLGIVTDIRLKDMKVDITFAFPYANTPIADKVIKSIEYKIRSLGFGFSHKTRKMNEVERARFIQLEIDSWKEKNNL